MRVFRKKWCKYIAVFCSLTFLGQIAAPTLSWALTGGPEQPETQGFQSLSVNDLVDPFTGNFNYSIPLLDVDGYPVTLSYTSGAKMDEESSWVGLGWSLTPGAINRNVRGLPDDFDGDIVTREVNIKPNRTYSANGTIYPEIFGIDSPIKIGFGSGSAYNNYTGFSKSSSVSPSLGVGKGATVGFDMTVDSKTGLSLSPSVSFSKKVENGEVKENDLNTVGLSVSTTYNSRAGLTHLGLQTSRGRDQRYAEADNKRHSLGGSSGRVDFGAPTYTPQSELPFRTTAGSLSFKFGADFFGVDALYNITGAYSQQKLKASKFEQKAYGYLNSDRAMFNKANPGYSATGAFIRDKLNVDPNSCEVDVLMDFNREKDGTYTPNTPNLPVTNLTYDLFSITGHGVGGQFRSCRGDLGYVFDPCVKSDNDSYSLGIDLGGGNLTKIGVDVSTILMDSQTGKWKENNELAKQANFRSKQDLFSERPDIGFENSYFKMPGEKTVQTDPEILKGIGGYSAVRPEFGKSTGFEVPLSNRLKDVSIPMVESRSEREYRQTTISSLKLNEVNNFGMDPTLYTDEEDAGSCPNCFDLTSRPGHHIGELTVLNTSGVRYVYGLPVYNNTKKEVTFASGKQLKQFGDRDALADHPVRGTVTYGQKDASINNTRGLDHYYKSVTTPEYAHSFLLTSIVSPDYVDNDDFPGPTDGDIGTYTKFNYTKAHSNYEWRLPVYSYEANAQKNLLSDELDDKASFVYGAKEIQYLESIETKNFIAKFEILQRADGFGVLGEHGGVDESKPLYYLSKIKLYPKQAYLADNTITPLKTVHFDYDYSLCPDVPNNHMDAVCKDGSNNCDINDPVENLNFNKGKLTLKKVYFTYQDSYLSKYNPYEFVYGGDNYEYSPKKYDRWGNYKDFQNSYSEVSEFPYTEQPNQNIELEVANANQRVSAWNLTQIKTPSGADFEIEYETDDYAFVQDRRAMQMFKVIGMSENNSDRGSLISDELFSDDQLLNKTYYKYLHVHLPVPVKNKEEFEKRYLRIGDSENDILEEFMFRFYVDLGESDSDFEYVPGFVQIERGGDGSPDLGVYGPVGDKFEDVWIKIEGVTIGDGGAGIQDDDVHPISKAAWQYARLYRPSVAYKTTEITDSDFYEVIMAMIGTSHTKGITEALVGVNRLMLKRNQGRKFEAAKSFVRMYNPESKKIGGGCRVKRVVMSDNASQSGLGSDFQYGVEYEYTLEDGTSSGVAAYEPLIGGDENPWHMPIAFLNKKEQRLLAPDDRNYLVGPMGESFFPSPVVGYSRVVSRSIGVNPESESIPDGFEYLASTTGTSIKEFYTSKDFPTITRQTSLNPRNKKSPWALKLLKIHQKEYVNVSQGYAITVNDMHGKPKSSWLYDSELNKRTSGTEFFYKVHDNGTLNNDVEVVDKDGLRSTAEIGVEVDMVNDFRESKTDIVHLGLNGNLAIFLVSVLPVTVPMILPSYAEEHTRFRSAVSTKVIHRFGLLEEVRVHDNQSTISTKNLAWDPVTGDVLETKTFNEFDDPIYSTSVPAHWAYDGMGPAASNISFEFRCTFKEDGIYPLKAPHGILYDGEGNVTAAASDYSELDHFAGGEEVIIQYNELLHNTAEDDPLREHLKHRFWVIRAANNDGCDCIMLRGGNPEENCLLKVVGDTQFKVIRSGRRNLSSVPLSQVTSRKDVYQPIDQNIPEGDAFWQLDESTEVLNNSAVVFNDHWGVSCTSLSMTTPSFAQQRTPYWIGVRGHYRPLTTYVFQTNRDGDATSLVRNQGYYLSVNPFWMKDPEAKFWTINADLEGWILTEQMRKYDFSSGQAVESQNALELPSAVLLGYRNTLPVAVGSNTTLRDFFFDGFEEYYEDGMHQSEYSYGIKTFKQEDNSAVTVEQSESHTGRTSVKVEEGEKAVLDLNPNCDAE